MILVKKNYILTLHKRLFFIREGWVLLSDKEKNKIEIEEYEISEKIKSEVCKIKKMELAFEEDFNLFSVNVNWLKENEEELLSCAKKNQSDNFAIKHLLYAVNWKILDENIVEKIKFYMELEHILNNNKDESIG